MQQNRFYTLLFVLQLFQVREKFDVVLKITNLVFFPPEIGLVISYKKYAMLTKLNSEAILMNETYN